MSATQAFTHPMIGKVLVIHVKSFTDREAHMRAELGRFGIPFEFVLDHDAVEITEAVEATYFVPGANLGKPAKSCCMKHFLAMQSIAKLPDDQFGLVLEDDVVLADNFAEVLVRAVEEAARLPAPRAVHLGCANNMHVPGHLIKRGQYLYEATQGRAADSFLIDPIAARRRVAYITENRIELPADHLFNRADEACGVRSFWLEPTIVEQGSMNGRFRSAIDDKRAKRSLARQFFHYHLKKIRIAIFDPIFRRNRKF